MSKTESNSSGKYRIDTDLRTTGFVKDPYTDEEYHVPQDETVIEVERADSAKRIVDSSGRMSFVGPAPSEKAVRKAQRERTDWAVTDLAQDFMDTAGPNLRTMDLGPENGFDPAGDSPNNDSRMTVVRAYDALKEAGHDDDAGFLRAIPTLSTQKDFARFAAERGVIDR